MEPVPNEEEIRITATNWLEEVGVDAGSTLEWTAPAAARTVSRSTRRPSARLPRPRGRGLGGPRARLRPLPPQRRLAPSDIDPLLIGRCGCVAAKLARRPRCDRHSARYPGEMTITLWEPPLGFAKPHWGTLRSGPIRGSRATLGAAGGEVATRSSLDAGTGSGREPRRGRRGRAHPHRGRGRGSRRWSSSSSVRGAR